VSRSPKAMNWRDYQLCYRCYCIRILKSMPKKGTGGTYMGEQKYTDFHSL
jgi:hypothetical protein